MPAVLVAIEIVLFALVDTWNPSWRERIISVLLCIMPAPVLVGGSLCIWLSTVNWTPRRRCDACFAVLTLIVVLALAAALIPFDEALGYIALTVASLVGSAGILVVLARICHEPRKGPDVPCPKCGYDLRGQHECRCPECGERFTVGELMGSDTEQPS